MELINIISKMLGKTIVIADSTSTQLHGGTVDNVVLYEGTAKTSDGECLPFKIVCKESGKWERYGDPDSWRREAESPQEKEYHRKTLQKIYEIKSYA